MKKYLPVYDILFSGLKLNYYLAIFIFLQIFFIDNAYSQIEWEYLNGPFGGLIKVVTSDKQNNLYAGSTFNGVFKYDQQQNKWSNITTGLFTEVSSLITNSSGHIFANVIGVGIYRSTDLGSSWKLLTKGIEGKTIFSLVINSLDILFAADSYTDGGIYQSTDNGETWQNILSSSLTLSVNTFAVNSKNQLFLTTLMPDKILRSTDNGISWKTIKDSTFLSSNISCIAIGQSDYIYLGTESKGIFRSTDNGDTWKQINNGINSYYITTITCGKNNILVAGTSDNGIFISKDNGNSWVQNSSLKTSYIVSSYSAPDGKIYLSTGGDGILNSSNGSDWNFLNEGLVNSYIRTIIPDSNNNIMCGTLYGGIFNYSVKSGKWTSLNNGLGNKEVLSLARTKNGNIFAGTGGDDIYMSSDHGGSWSEIDNNFWYKFILPLERNEKFGFFAGVAGSGIYRSTDEGLNWNLFGQQIYGINKIVINSKGYVYYCSSNEKLYYTTDLGSTWQEIIISTVNPYINEIAINSKDYLFVSIPVTGEGIYCSKDDGKTWTSTKKITLNEFHITLNDYIFASDFYSGAYLSKDDGYTWSNISTGLSTSSVITFASDDEGYVYIGTRDGLYRSKKSVTSVQKPLQNVTTYNLFQNYPNPFNPSTVISFQAPEKAFVSIKVYDILGKEIATLINEEKPAGLYKIDYSPKNISSGIYFYKINCRKYCETKKMMYLR